MRNGSLFWGAVLILLGVLMLLGAMEYFWPVTLILVGGWILAGAYFRTSAKSESVSVALNGAREVALKLNHGAGRLKVTGGASAGKALEGECTEGIRVDSQRSGERLAVRVGADTGMLSFLGNSRGLNWNLRLSNEVPFTLELETGANQSLVDLCDVGVTRLNVQTGVSATEITLPARGHVTAEAHVGAADLKLRVPPGVAGRIRSQSGLAEIDVDRARFPYLNGVYESPDFGANPNRADITIEAGVGKVSIW
ncbi:MAG: hypothetical protein HFACDABA_01142 [Anaerolineales bacterium]|nr:hypothetical protein [Anaerolineales bacterium]